MCGNERWSSGRNSDLRKIQKTTADSPVLAMSALFSFNALFAFAWSESIFRACNENLLLSVKGLAAMYFRYWFQTAKAHTR